MVKNGDRWVIAAFHYSANVFDNPILDRYKRVMSQGGIALGLVALFIGFGIAFAMGRRQRGRA
jgi:hypothetical protein